MTTVGPRPVFDRFRDLWPLVVLLVLVSLVTYLGTLGPASLDRTATTMIINLILVVGTYAFIGLSGVFSFGHIAFAMVGAYAYAYMAIPVETKAITMPDLPQFLAEAQVSPIPATLIAGFAAALLALIVSAPLTRMTGLSAALGTFAVLIIVNQIARNWQNLTNGTSGVPAIPTTTTALGATLWALPLIAVVFFVQQSRHGLRLRASREDEVAAQSVAIRISILRAGSLVLSAFICGVAGALSAALLGAFGPGTFFLEQNFLILVMLVIGGLKSLSGAVVGAMVVSVLSELLRRVEGGIDLGFLEFTGRPGLREVGLAIIFLVILIIRPAGIMGGREITWPFGNTPRRRPGEPAEQESSPVAPGQPDPNSVRS